MRIDVYAEHGSSRIVTAVIFKDRQFRRKMTFNGRLLHGKGPVKVGYGSGRGPQLARLIHFSHHLKGNSQYQILALMSQPGLQIARRLAKEIPANG